ncbi:MAG: septum formation initiator family protein [Endomicrobium sp.]|jgi:cell division protein FtsB|nr:septum formation initiator family protein [Endomicrobium sp.]
MNKIKARYYIILALALSFLAFNAGSRTLVRRFFEYNKMQKDFQSAKYQNSLLKKRIYYLENEPSYLERMVRSELGVIAPGEIEYRFLSKDAEKKIKEKKKDKENV